MKLVNKGYLIKKKYLPKTEVPESAVLFKEPETQFSVNLVAFLFIVVSVFIIWALFSVAEIFNGAIKLNLQNAGAIFGLIVGLMSLSVQEIFRGFFYSKDAVVSMYYTYSRIYTICFEPISKWAFIRMGIIPSIIVGWVPLAVAVFVPMSEGTLNFLFAWGFIAVIFSNRYYVSVFNALTQMPKGALAVTSGIETYWFEPKEYATME